MRKTLPLSEQDPIYYDYYLSGGSERGIKPGALVSVFRRKWMGGDSNHQKEEMLVVEVGKLRVIHVQKGLSVARLYDVPSEKEVPTLWNRGIMMGDLVQLSTKTSPGE